jgi:hypothetical protein
MCIARPKATLWKLLCHQGGNCFIKAVQPTSWDRFGTAQEQQQSEGQLTQPYASTAVKQDGYLANLVFLMVSFGR